MYGADTGRKVKQKVLKEGHPTFKELFRMCYENMEEGDGKLSNWTVNIPCGFHSRRRESGIF